MAVSIKSSPYSTIILCRDNLVIRPHQQINSVIKTTLLVCPKCDCIRFLDHLQPITRKATKLPSILWQRTSNPLQTLRYISVLFCRDLFGTPHQISIRSVRSLMLRATANPVARKRTTHQINIVTRTPLFVVLSLKS